MPSHKLLISLFFLACLCLDPSPALATEGTENTAPEEDLHFIKSSALNLGFSNLSALCQAGERQAASGEAGGVDLAPVFAEML